MTAKISLCRSRNILVFSRRLRFPIAVFVSITFPSESEGPTNHAPRYLQYLEAMDTYIFKCYASCQQWHPFLCTFSDSFDSTFDSTLPSCNIITLKLDITYYIVMITPLFLRVVLLASLLKLTSLVRYLQIANGWYKYYLVQDNTQVEQKMSFHGYTVLDGTS